MIMKWSLSSTQWISVLFSSCLFSSLSLSFSLSLVLSLFLSSHSSLFDLIKCMRVDDLFVSVGADYSLSLLCVRACVCVCVCVCLFSLYLSHFLCVCVCVWDLFPLILIS